eukprot:scaffold58193_cov75-Phaeocystis_antarctica.AAC.2
MQCAYLERDEERPPRAALAGHRLPEHLARRRRRPQLEPTRVLAQRDHAATELPETQDRLTSLGPELGWSASGLTWIGPGFGTDVGIGVGFGLWRRRAACPGGSGKAALSARSASSSASPGAGAALYEKACVHPRLRRPLPVAKPSIDRLPAASQVAAPSPHHHQREDSHPGVVGCRVRASSPPRMGTDLLRGMLSTERTRGVGENFTRGPVFRRRPHNDSKLSPLPATPICRSAPGCNETTFALQHP